MTVLHGLTTMVLTADDVDAAATWYGDVLGVAPYFRRPETGPAAYVEFRIGPDEDELGIMDRTFAPACTTGAGTSITYWQVDGVGDRPVRKPPRGDAQPALGGAALSARVEWAARVSGRAGRPSRSRHTGRRHCSRWRPLCRLRAGPGCAASRPPRRRCPSNGSRRTGPRRCCRR